MKVRKAVIPAAGLGTRMLPATKTVPKEMLPMVDKPVIQYIIEEAVASGIEDILIVTNRAKSAMDDYFDYYPELETRLLQAGKEQELVEVRRAADHGGGDLPVLRREKGDDLVVFAVIRRPKEQRVRLDLHVLIPFSQSEAACTAYSM